MTAVEAEHLNDPVYWELLETIQGQHPAYDLEVRNGEYVVVFPGGMLSSVVAVDFASRIRTWTDTNKLGRVFSRAGIVFSDGDLIGPDVAYVSKDRMPVVPQSFARVIPELVIEFQRGTGTERACRAKIALQLEKGIDVAVYVNPMRRSVEIHRAGAEPAVLGDGDRFDVPDVLPGFGFAVDELWPE